MAKRVGVDKWIFFTTLLLVVVGLAMVFSASAIIAQEHFHTPYALALPPGRLGRRRRPRHGLLMSVDYARYNSPRFIFPALAVTTVLLVVRLLLPQRPARPSLDPRRPLLLPAL